jgi:hypothetical protein
MTFREGQKVQCIDAIGSGLALNGTYTIRKVHPPFKCRWRGEVGTHSSVWLYEVDPESVFFGFCDKRFKPINDCKTNIHIFKEILLTKREDA